MVLISKKIALTIEIEGQFVRLSVPYY